MTALRVLVWLCLSLGADPNPPSKKDLYLADKERAAENKTPRRFPPKVGAPPAAIINIYNRWTQEMLVVDVPTKKSKEEIPAADIASLLRCHFTNQAAPAFDTRLFTLMIRAAAHFRSPRIEIVSGYRAPKYNLMLRKKGHYVARDSQHALGRAVDFRLAGVPTQALLQFVRKQRLGGVGFYPHGRFVHADTGPVRYWLGD